MGYIVMSYTANDVKALRDKTYCSLKKCKEAFDYADTHKGTLVVVTADHETGGVTLLSGSKDCLS